MGKLRRTVNPKNFIENFMRIATTGALAKDSYLFFLSFDFIFVFLL